MSNIDMVMFSQDGTKDLWSEGYGIPKTDETNDYFNMGVTMDNDVVTVSADRNRVTGDSEDFQFD